MFKVKTDFSGRVRGHQSAAILVGTAVTYAVNVLYQQSMLNKEKYLVCSYLYMDIFVLHPDVTQYS